MFWGKYSAALAMQSTGVLSPIRKTLYRAVRKKIVEVNYMTEQEKFALLETAKNLFRESFAANHYRNTQKLEKVDEFAINPFLHKYLTMFAFGEYTPENRAKALIYPRAFGTSLTTGFGAFIQILCNKLRQSYPSTTAGMDIEFEDTTDGRHKYCQLKAGPNTINKDDVKTVKDHFRDAINLARTNGRAIASMDCVVGVCYGKRNELSANYKKINEDYPVLIGEEFWARLTGDNNFYEDLINAFAEVATDINGTEMLEETIHKLTADIEIQDARID